jgi:hypothetical protein
LLGRSSFDFKNCRTCACIKSVTNEPASLPADLAATHAMILAERHGRHQAEALVSVARLEIERLKLLLAKARREQFGQTSERGKRLIDQLELQLAELEETAAEDKAAKATAGTIVAAHGRQRRARRFCASRAWVWNARHGLSSMQWRAQLRIVPLSNSALSGGSPGTQAEPFGHGLHANPHSARSWPRPRLHGSKLSQGNQFRSEGQSC